MDHSSFEEILRSSTIKPATKRVSTLNVACLIRLIATAILFIVFCCSVVLAAFHIPTAGAGSVITSSKQPSSTSSRCVSQAQLLHNLPSSPGPHIKRIEQLGNNSWLSLGAPSPDANCGKARGRVWTSKMAYAPDLHGAFLFGTGVHGWYNRDTGRYMDDLWFYDALAHKWIVVYPGTEVDNPGLSINDDGFLVNESGDLVPVATMVHGYEMTTYDSDTRRFMSVDCPGEYWRKTLASIVDLVAESHQALRGVGLSPWFFDTKTLRWNRYKTAAKAPRTSFGGTLIYLPSKKKTFFRLKKQVWLYDAEANVWTRMNPSGPPPPFGIEATACYDPKRDRIYIGGGIHPMASGPNALWIYDVESNSWIDPKPSGNAGSNQYSHNTAMMHCDLVNDVVVVTRHKGGSDRGVFIYDPDENAWSVATRSFPAQWPEKPSTGASSGYYDPVLNAHFFHVAADSRDNGVILVYRYKRRP